MAKKGSSNKPDTDPKLSGLPELSESSYTANDSGRESHPVDPITSDKQGDQERTAFSSSSHDSLVHEETDSTIGKVIADKYQILELLGTGGMSRVYKAQQLLTQKRVALKLLHKHLSSNPVMMRRFQAEAQASHHLAHPHIITVYDFGLTEDNQPFIVMDYLEGRALSDIVRTWGQLSIDRCLKILDQILDALEHAHDSGVLHRDLKPSNIVLIPVGDNTDYVKLVDFGIAKILPKAGLEAQELTQSGDVFGSPLYMSPEQCLGNMTDARSDIYAVGCLLYECLTGKPPLVGNNTLETMHKQVSEMPAGLGNLKADVRLVKQLEDLVFKAMAKEPENRFQQASEMRKAIEQTRSEWKEGSAWLAYLRRTGSICERFFQNKLGKRWRVKVALSAVLGLITLHYLMVMSVLYRPGSAPDLDQRIIPWAAAEQHLHKLVAAEKLRRIRPVTDNNELNEMANFSEMIASSSTSASAAFRTKLYYATDKMYHGEFDNALATFKDAVQMADSVGMSDSLDTGYLHLALASCLLAQNDMRASNDQRSLMLALNEARNAVLVFHGASQEKPVSIAKTIEGEISNRLEKHIEASLSFRHAAMNIFSFASSRIDRQRSKENLSSSTPIEFKWGDANQASMGYQLALLGKFFLEKNEGANIWPAGQPLSRISPAAATIPGMPCVEEMNELVFDHGRLERRTAKVQTITTKYIVDAENAYQLLVGLCEQRGSGRGALTTAVARANLGMARLKKGIALRNLCIEKLRDRNFEEANQLFNQAQNRFQSAAKDLHLAYRALELHLGSNHKYLGYTLLNLSDAELNMGKFNEALETRTEAQKVLGSS